MASNSDDWRKEVDTARLEIDRARLELERYGKQLERERVFLERWKTDVSPVQERKERSREFTNQYAQISLKAPFLLNGGAVIAFPAFAKIVDVAVTKNSWVFVASILAFVVGLVATSIANLVAYQVMDVDTVAIRSSEEILKTKLNATQNTDGKLTDQQQGHVAKHEALVLELDEKTKSLKKWSMKLGISSIGLFVIGAILAAIVMASAT